MQRCSMKAKLPVILRMRSGHRGLFSIMMHLLARDATANAKAGRSCPLLQAQLSHWHYMAFLREHVHLGKVWTDGWDEVVHAWLNEAYGFSHLHLCNRTAPTLVVPVLF